LAMIQIYNFIKNEAEPDSVFLILQVHDELVFEIRDDLVDMYAKRIKQIMEGVFNFSVKFEVGVGIAENWELAH